MDPHKKDQKLGGKIDFCWEHPFNTTHRLFPSLKNELSIDDILKSQKWWWWWCHGESGHGGHGGGGGGAMVVVVMGVMVVVGVVPW